MGHFEAEYQFFIQMEEWPFLKFYQVILMIIVSNFCYVLFHSVM